MEFLSEIQAHWLWFALAMVLMMLELLWGRFFCLPASMAALVVGVLSQLYPYVGGQVQLLFFVVLAVIFVWLARSWLKERSQQRLERAR